MRILSIGSVYPPHLLGGYEVMWQGVTHELTAQGHDSCVLVSDYHSPDVPAGAPEDPGVHRELRWYWREHRWPRLSVRERIALERHNASVLDRHLSRFHPDVIAFWPMGGMSLSLITRARRAGLATIFFAHDPWMLYGPRMDQWLALWCRSGWRRLAGPAARLTGLGTQLDLTRGQWVFCSEWMRRNAGLELGPEQQAVLTPGIEARYLSAPVRPPQWSWQLLYLGRVVEQKGVDTAIDALALLPTPATLTIRGSGNPDYRRKLEQRAGKLGVSDRVRWLGPVDREATVAGYAAADVVLHPVRWGEPWGLVPLEAMGVGRPVLATGQGGSADFLVDGANCLLHPPGDTAALAAAVQRLAGDPSLRSELVAAGRRTAEAHTAAAFNQAAVQMIVRAGGG
jgi:glycogen(starch) synthase